MSTDPMTSYEQAEAEAVERQDEARREQHYAEAEHGARAWLDYFREVCGLDDRAAVEKLLPMIDGTGVNINLMVLGSFRADYGTPALLRVIARALDTTPQERQA